MKDRAQVVLLLLTFELAGGELKSVEVVNTKTGEVTPGDRALELWREHLKKLR